MIGSVHVLFPNNLLEKKGMEQEVEELITGMVLALPIIFPYLLKYPWQKKNLKRSQSSWVTGLSWGNLAKKKYRAAQLYGWLYAKAAQSFQRDDGHFKGISNCACKNSRDFFIFIFVTQKNLQRWKPRSSFFGLHDGLAYWECFSSPLQKKIPVKIND